MVDMSSNQTKLNQTRGLHKVPGRPSVALDQGSSGWKTLYLTTGLYTVPQKQKNLVLAAITSPQHLAA